MVEKLVTIILACLLIAYLAVVGYAFRGYYFTIHDPHYWQERYSQSQWQFPISPRVLGDDGLYLAQGDLLIQGKDPTLYNPEVPPVGKYLIGLTTHTLHNGPILGFIVSSAVILIFYWVCFLLFRSTLFSLTLTLLLAVDPLFTDQFHLTMMDSLQLLFFLLTVLCLVYYSRNKNLWSLLAAAATLSLAAGTKVPVLAFPLALFITLYLLAKRNVHSALLFILTFAAFYVLPYIQYFRLGHSLREWISVQSFMAKTYLMSKLEAPKGVLFTSLLFNRTASLFTGERQTASFFSLAWPFLTLAGLLGAIRLFFTKYLAFLFISTYVLLFIIIFSWLPFWQRYLVTLLPFFILSLGYLLHPFYLAYRTVVVIGLCFVIGLHILPTSKVLFPTPESTVRQFLYDWEHGFFADMYQHIDSTTTHSLTRDAFTTMGLTVFTNLQIETITASIAATPEWRTRERIQNIPVRITYVTRHLGPLSHTTDVPIIYEQGRWKIAWDWSLLLPHFQPQATISTVVHRARRGTLYDTKGRILAQDIQSAEITILPTQLVPHQESSLSTLIAELLGSPIEPFEVHHRYAFNRLMNYAVPIGVPVQPLTNSQINHLLTFSGIQLQPAFIRTYPNGYSDTIGTLTNTTYLECCSRLYSASNYRGMSGYEQRYDTQLSGQNGGSISMIYPNGATVVLLSRPKQDGEHIRIDSE